MNQVFSVSQITSAIKQKLESNFSFVSVQGEVSNLRRQASGHTYFTLKDKDAQISSVLFFGSSKNVSRPLKEGDQITVRGSLSVYAPRGNYQIIVREVEFSGIGELLSQLHTLKIKLQGLGWFEKSAKKPLPPFPKKIGVITSPSGSVIQDIIHVLSRRFSGFELLLNPVPVQGKEAAFSIATAIKEMNAYNLADVLIVGRGGGSLEDLWPFNEEIVAKAIWESKIPVISAVGHETDFTIADFVADVRAPTPSAAAEIVMGEKKAVMDHFSKMHSRMSQLLLQRLQGHKKMLTLLASQAPLSNPLAMLSPFMQKVDGIKEEADKAITMSFALKKQNLTTFKLQHSALNPSTKILHHKQTFHTLSNALSQTIKKKIFEHKEQLKSIQTHLRAINPKNVLKRGYSIVFREKKDSVILKASDVEKEECLRIQLADGKLTVKVNEKL